MDEETRREIESVERTSRQFALLAASVVGFGISVVGDLAAGSGLLAAGWIALGVSLTFAPLTQMALIAAASAKDGAPRWMFGLQVASFIVGTWLLIAAGTVNLTSDSNVPATDKPIICGCSELCCDDSAPTTTDPLEPTTTSAQGPLAETQ